MNPNNTEPPKPNSPEPEAPNVGEPMDKPGLNEEPISVEPKTFTPPVEPQASSTQPVNSGAAAWDNSSAQKPKKKHTGLIVTLVVVVILILAAVGVAIFQMNQANQAAKDYRAAVTSSIDAAVDAIDSEQADLLAAIKNQKAELKSVVAGKIISGDYKGAAELVAEYDKIYGEILNYATNVELYNQFIDDYLSIAKKMNTDITSMASSLSNSSTAASALNSLADKFEAYATQISDLSVPADLQAQQKTVVDELNSAAGYYREAADAVTNTNETAYNSAVSKAQTAANNITKAETTMDGFQDKLDEQRTKIENDIADFKTKVNS